MTTPLQLLSILFCCTCVLMLVSTGCSPSQDRPADFIFVCGEENKSLDPQKISWLTDFRLASCLYEPLLRVNPQTLALEPGVAERWQVSRDQLTYTFFLREDAKWSNGDPVTAYDFIFAWRRALLPDLAADYTQLLFTIKGAQDFYRWRIEQLKNLKHDGDGDSDGDGDGNDAVKTLWLQTEQKFKQAVGVRAEDGHTLVVQLEKPTAYFLELMAFVTFMPAHVASVEAATTLDADTGSVMQDASYFTDPSRLITNGPYVLQERKFKQYAHLVANKHYWNVAQMKNSSIRQRIIAQPQTALLAYENGQVDWLPDMPSASSTSAHLLASKRADLHLQPMVSQYFYNFNCRARLNDGSVNPLADKRVRQALSMAVDRQLLVTSVTRLNQPVAGTFVPIGSVVGYTPPAESGIGFDPAQAKRLLEQAGYADGSKLKGLSILYNTGFGHEKIAQAVARMWEKHLGVSVVLEGMEGLKFKQRLKEHDFTISRATWFGDYRDPTTWLDKMRVGNGNNDCAYANSRYDALLDRAANTTADKTQRLALLAQAEAIMLRDAPMAIFYQMTDVHLYDTQRVKGLTTNPWAIYQLEKVFVVRP